MVIAGRGKMSKRFSILLVVLTIVSGLIGGAITGRIFTPKVAISEEEKQSKVLTVEELRIIDKSGKLLMQLGKSPNDKNFCGLAIYDNSGNSVAFLGNGYNNGTVIVSGKGGDAMMRVDESGGNISVSDKSCEGAVIGMRPSGGHVIVHSKDCAIGAMMSINESGDGAVYLFDKNGNKLK
jgi:hypothetical protein